MSLKQRELELAKELQSMSITCFICHLSEEKKRCEIISDGKCKKDICVECYKLHKSDSCMICAQRIEQHYKKSKVSQKGSIFEQASKMYNRENKIRSNQEFSTLDFDFINLMVYYNAHPQVSVRKKYEEVEKEVKKILQNRKKDQRTIVTENSKVRQAKIFEKVHEQTCSGVDSCGYNRRYEKGINLLRLGWGYPALTSEQFSANSQIIRKDKPEAKPQVRDLEQLHLKLNKKKSDSSPPVKPSRNQNDQKGKYFDQ